MMIKSSLLKSILFVKQTRRIVYTVFQKNDAKIQINIFNKIHRTVSEQQVIKNGTQKQKFPIWKIPISILTAGSVTNSDVMLVTFLKRVWLT